MQTTAEPRLVLKTTPPRHSRQLLERPRLGSPALRLQDRHAVLVEAPPGFGKTSLLAQWRREWLAAGAYVAWLNLDEDDSTPSRFTQALAFAMEQATGVRSFARIRSRTASSPDDLDRMTEWLAEVASLGADTVLILDEGERMPAGTARQTLPYLLANLPPNLRLVLARRGTPAFGDEEAVARAPVLRFTAERLRFTPAETIAALQMRLGGTIDAGTAQHIHELTEGWPLGLQLFISRAEQGVSPREAAEQLATQSGDLRRQLVGLLLANLPPDRHEFLVRISILDRLHAELCASLTGRSDAASILSELRDTTPLLVADLEGDWLRLHGLVRDCLRESFDALPSGARKAAHAAAAAWLEDAGLWDQGARHALQAGRQHWAWEMAEKSLLGMLERGQISQVQEWLERSPVPREQQPPRLVVTAGWCCVLNGQTAEAEALAQRALQDPRADAGDRLRARAVLSSAAIFMDDIDRAAELMAPWREQLEANPQLDRFNAFNQLAWLALHSGDVTEARRLLAIAQPAEPRPFVMEVYRALVWGLLHRWEGRVELAIEAVQRVSERSDAETGRRSNLSANLGGLLAAVLFENGSIDEADAALAGRLDVLEKFGAPSALLAGYLAASRIAYARGDHARAQELLESLCATGERRRLPRAQLVALKELIRQYALLDHGHVCEHLLARLQATAQAAGPALTGRWREMAELYLNLAGAWAARGRHDWQQVMEYIEAVAPTAHRLHRGGEVVEIDLLRAEAQEGLGQDAAPIHHRATGLAASLGLKVLAAASHGEQPAIQGDTPARAPRVVPTPLLTPAEQRILGLLAERLSNKEIADRLDLGPTTVKWHLKNAYSKLNAANRDHAVQRARMLGILSTH